MQRRFLFFVSSTAVFVTAFLLLDRSGLVPQLLLGSAAVLFLFGFARISTVPGVYVRAGWRG